MIGTPDESMTCICGHHFLDHRKSLTAPGICELVDCPCPSYRNDGGLWAEVATLRADQNRVNKIIWYRMRFSHDPGDDFCVVSWEDIYHTIYVVEGATGREAIDAAIAMAEKAKL